MVRDMTADLPGGLDWTHTFYVVTIIMSLIADIMLPLLFFRHERAERLRQKMHEDNKAELKEGFLMASKRMDHLDECIDEFKEAMRKAVATKEDVSELAQRIFRLENNSFKKGGWL